MPEHGYLTLEEVAKELDLSIKTIKEYLNEGKLKGDRNPVSGSWIRVKESDLQEFLTGKPVEPSKQLEKQTGELSEVADARQQTTLEKELAEQAKLQNERHKAEFERDLRQKGYNSIEIGLIDIEEKHKEAMEIFEVANKERASVRSELEAVAKEKQKVVTLLAVIKEREKLVNEKWTDIQVKEESQKTFVGKYEGLRKELVELVEYHKTHVIPCNRALRTISRTIYTWADILNTNSGYDFTELYNFIGKSMKVIDQYTDRVPTSIGNINSGETLDDNGASPSIKGSEG